jgi:hypothetical protein
VGVFASVSEIEKQWEGVFTVFSNGRGPLCKSVARVRARAQTRPRILIWVGSFGSVLAQHYRAFFFFPFLPELKNFQKIIEKY